MRNRSLVVTLFGLVVLGVFVYLVMGSSEIKVVKDTVSEMGEDFWKSLSGGPLMRCEILLIK